MVSSGADATAEVQLSLFLDFVCKADELALNFEEGLGLSRKNEFSEEQRVAVERLDQLLDSISGPENARFWTDEALRSDATWEDVRALAKQAAAAFGWEIQAPPPSDDIYIPGA